VAGGVRSDGVEVVYLAYSSAGQLCIENYQSYNFLKTYCVEGGRTIHDLVFHNARLFLSLPATTYILTEDLELIHRVDEPMIDLVREAAVFKSHSYDYIRRERLTRQPLWCSREDLSISVAQSGSHLTVFRDDIELFQVAHDAARSQLLRGWFQLRSELEF
jgi:hypothetical protein